MRSLRSVMRPRAAAICTRSSKLVVCSAWPSSSTGVGRVCSFAAREVAPVRLEAYVVGVLYHAPHLDAVLLSFGDHHRENGAVQQVTRVVAYCNPRHAGIGLNGAKLLANPAPADEESMHEIRRFIPFSRSKQQNARCVDGPVAGMPALPRGDAVLPVAHYFDKTLDTDYRRTVASPSPSKSSAPAQTSAW